MARQVEGTIENLSGALQEAKSKGIIPEDSFDIPDGFEMRHSSECTLTLHGNSLAGCLKVRWKQGERAYYRDCCKGVIEREQNNEVEVIAC